MSILKPRSSLTEIYSKLTTCGKSYMRLLFKKEPSRIFWKYISDTITSASTKGLIKRKQAELGVPHSKSKLSGQNQNALQAS